MDELMKLIAETKELDEKREKLEVEKEKNYEKLANTLTDIFKVFKEAGIGIFEYDTNYPLVGISSDRKGIFLEF